MTDQLEQDLRSLFAYDADHAPAEIGTIRRSSKHVLPRGVVLWVSTGLVAAAIATLVAIIIGSRQDNTNNRAATPSTSDHSTTPSPTPTRVMTLPASASPSGQLPFSLPSLDCIAYSPKIAALDATIAFDGTVIQISATHPQRTDQIGPLVTTTFAVHEWFRGGPRTRITVSVPVQPNASSPAVVNVPYRVGTRLLISANRPYLPTNGQVVASSACGYARYYDAADAAAWRIAFRTTKHR